MDSLNRERDITAGGTFGNDAVEHIDRRAEAYSEHERQRITLINEPQLNALHMEGTYLLRRERDVVERLARAAAPHEIHRRGRRAVYYWTTGILLAIAAFFFSLIAFQPFRLGWMAVWYCIGIALVTPFAVEEFLDAWKNENFFKLIVTGVFCAALTGGALLAAVRGDLLAQQVKQPEPAVMIDGQPVVDEPAQENSFYETTRGLLRMLMVFLALAIDLASGIAIHKARLLSNVSGEDPVTLSRELRDIEQRLTAIVFEMTALRNGPDIFVSQFWRDFYRAMLRETVRRALSKVVALSFLLVLFSSACARAASEPIALVAALDLSASEAVKGRDPQSAFRRSVEGISKLLGSLPAGTDVTVIGITENSYALPYILLSAKIAVDEGYFGERLAGAHGDLIRAWRNRAATLAPDAKGTDILGALFFTEQIFTRVPIGRKKVLVLFSDMRHVTRELDLERPPTIDMKTAFRAIRGHGLQAHLSDVAVYVVGAEAQGKSFQAWDGLRQFWTMYFERAGARIAGYSFLADPPMLQP